MLSSCIIVHTHQIQQIEAFFVSVSPLVLFICPNKSILRTNKKDLEKCAFFNIQSSHKYTIKLQHRGLASSIYNVYVTLELS